MITKYIKIYTGFLGILWKNFGGVRKKEGQEEFFGEGMGIWWGMLGIWGGKGLGDGF